MRPKTLEPNVGALDRWFRLFGGLALLSFATSGRLGKAGSFLGVLFGASTVATGICRFSLLYDFLGISTHDSRRVTSSLESPPVSTSALPREFPWDSVQKTRPREIR